MRHMSKGLAMMMMASLLSCAPACGGHGSSNVVYGGALALTALPMFSIAASQSTVQGDSTIGTVMFTGLGMAMLAVGLFTAAIGTGEYATDVSNRPDAAPHLGAQLGEPRLLVSGANTRLVEHIQAAAREHRCEAARLMLVKLALLQRELVQLLYAHDAQVASCAGALAPASQPLRQ